jgi:2-haloacid dehalogenase
MTNSPKAVVFDVGRVLYQWQLRALFEQLIADPQELDWFLANVVTEGWHHQHDAGRPLAEMIPERQALFPRYAHLIEAYATRFLDTVPGPVDGTHALVERLAARGVPLYALTNFGVEFWAEFRPTAPIFDRFADIVVSGAEQCAKPDPAIYAIAERRFGHAPEALFFTDDNPANVAAARALGWDAEVFTDAASLEAALTTRGLL